MKLKSNGQVQFARHLCPKASILLWNLALCEDVEPGDSGDMTQKMVRYIPL